MWWACVTCNNTGAVMEIPLSCCHAELLSNAAIWLDNADSTVTLTKTLPVKPLGEARTLGWGLLTPPPIVHPHSPGNHEALSVPNTHRGGREQGSRGWERKMREWVSHSVSFFRLSWPDFLPHLKQRGNYLAKASAALVKRKEATIKREPLIVIWLPQSCQDKSAVVRKQFDNLAMCLPL